MLQGPKTQRAELDRIRVALKAWRPVRAELINYTKTGEEFWLELDIVPVADENGGYTHWIAIERDITDRKLVEAARETMEAQLRELQKMEAIGTLAGGIAHDFNNIIATMLGNAELARRNLDRDHAAVESINEIMKAGRRARELVQQILTFSRRQASALVPTALGSIVEEVARMLSVNLSADIHIEVSVAANAPLVRADSTQMMQVLMNLGTNAIQAMRGRAGTLHMAVEAVASTFLPSVEPGAGNRAQPAVRLMVRDSGSGMDKATLDRMFEPFFTTKSLGEGTGLGLSVVRGIVESHGGVINVSSTPGSGTCFTIDLPVESGVPAVSQPAGSTLTVSASAPAKVGAGRHILYLDDDDSLVFLVRRLLEHDGFKVSAFSLQSEAIAAVEANADAFDLVITDFNMPGMNGIEVTQELFAINPALKVAIASGFIDEALTQAARHAGVSKLIFKESAIEDFCAVIQELINETK
jgi:signal transduction histidine kinase/ActR/RegA family two-component response regulator